MPDAEQVLVIYTTATENKPTYRRGILDTLCYPNGHIQRYSYRRSQIQPALLDSIQRNEGMEAVVVFVDIDNNKLATYFPLRFVRVLKPISANDDDGSLGPGERVNLALLLGDFVEYTDMPDERKWHSLVSRFDERRNFQNGTPTYFVIQAPNIFLRSERTTLMAWEAIVTAVSKSAKLRDAVFLRLNHLKTIDPSRADPKLLPYSRLRRMYEVRPAQVYELNLAVFEHPRGTPRDETQLSVSCSNELVELDQPSQSIVSGLAEKSALVSCKRTVEDTIAVLTIKLKEPTRGVVNTPRPILHLHISLPGAILWTFVLLVFAGGLFVSADSNLIKEISATSYPVALALACKIVGSACLARAAHLALRQLPSGKL